MDVFLIKNKSDSYQEVLKVSCIIKTSVGNHTYEKRLFSNIADFPNLSIKDSYELNEMGDIRRVEEIYKKELLNLIMEQIEKKLDHSRWKIANHILKVNGREVFNLTRDFEKVWECTEKEVEERINKIQFDVLENGDIHNCALDMGYLI